ncbi:MAG: peptidoglycan-binding protein [Rhodospirillales bacterium]|jgi:peptidoglycan hydrolase-like protein with peptidoglycan-binding domain|nr:peptidoglycan-binding protein [Rhodospirillales bacterium]
MTLTFPGRLYNRSKNTDKEIHGLKNLLQITNPVGNTSSNNRRDVAKVETLLGKAGYLDLDKTDGPTGYYGERLKQSVQRFQKANGLKKDGLINPRGETMRILVAQNSNSIEGPTPPNDPTSPTDPIVDTPTSPDVPRVNQPTEPEAPFVKGARPRHDLPDGVTYEDIDNIEKETGHSREQIINGLWNDLYWNFIKAL